jgi:hypothetical protein
MVKKGLTAVAKTERALMWKGRRCLANRTVVPGGTVGVVTGVSRCKHSGVWTRADIGGVIHTLHPWDWEFTTLREGELRRWRDGRSGPFLILKIERLGYCECIEAGRVFGTSCTYIEEYSEVLSD